MELTTRQAEIAAYVARGLSVNAIARATGLSPKTVDRHIQNAASHLPGEGRPMHRLTLWFLALTTEGEPHP